MASEEVKDLAEAIGGCGKFQVYITLATIAATLSSSGGLMFMVFGMYNPGWICLDNFDNNISALPSSALGISSLTTQSPSHVAEANLNLDGVSWNETCATATTCKRRKFNAESSTILTEWNLVCDERWASSVIISVQMVGVLVGCYLSGQISDTFGRMKGLYSIVAIHGVAHLVAFFSVSWPMYAAVQFFAGVGASGIGICLYPYILEFTTERWRGVLAAIPFWPIGFLSFAILVNFVRNWRYLHIVVAAYSGCVLLLAFWTPESIRWLAVRGKVEQAKKVVAKVARTNGRPCPDTRIIDEVAKEERKKMGDHKYTYLDLFRIPSLRPLIIKFSIIYTILAYVYFVINFSVSALYGDFYINFIIAALIEFPALIFLTPIVNIFGRRKALLAISILQMTCCIMLVVFNFATSGGVKDLAILCLVLLCKTLTMAAWGVIPIYSSELFPTVVRNLHFGFINGASRIGAILSPYLVPDDPNKLYVCFVVIGVIGMIQFGLLLSLPESKGYILRDLAETNKSEMKKMKEEDIDLI